jgi:crotonobetainyl-CoA:carnitine CoA-transferase CaiB-like acyl-CoA transferase
MTVRTAPAGEALRVLDLTDELGWQGARLLVGLGADVLRVDPAEGREPAERLHWHAGKRWVRLPVGAAGREALDALAGEADVVLESGPRAELRGLLPAGGSRWPRAIHVCVTPFGLTGPRRDWRADDLVLASAGGMAWLGGRPDGAPKPPPHQQANQLAGAHGALAALLGVLARDRTGRGQLIDVSAQEAVAAALETGAVAWIHARRVPARTGGVYEHVAHRIFRASDGYVAGGYSGSPRMWTDLLAWLAEEGEAGPLVDPRWEDPVLRWQGRAEVDAVLADFVRKRSARELAAEGRRRALPWAEVVPPERLLENPQLRERGFFSTVTGEGLPPEGVPDAGFPADAPGLPRPVRLSALHEAPTGRAWRGSGPHGVRQGRSGAAGHRPLSGVRVLDLTWVLAGPYATKFLAEHGAEIVKIESRHRKDPTRFSPSMHLRPGGDPDDSGYFLNFNRNKRSVALNLRTEQGRTLLRELVPHMDVVVENFSPGVLARWGMDYQALRELNPGVVLVSMAGVGQSGPWREAVTFADTLAAMSGLAHATRDPGGVPQGLTFGLGDMVAANAAALHALDLLARGVGGHVDLSQLEAMAATMGPAVAEGRLPSSAEEFSTPERLSRSHRCVPHGVFRAAGEDRWIAVAVQEDRQWRALVDLAAVPALDALREADAAGRRRNEDEIDAAIEEWTSRWDAGKLAARLQTAGVAAAAVADGRDLVEADEQLAARGFYPVLDHPIAGPIRHEGIVARLADTPGELTAPAPLLGQHTRAVLGELLGLGEERLDELAAEGVLE